MIKIESLTLEEAYKNAASSLECSVTQLNIEVIQYPSKGILGLFKKTAIIVATKKHEEPVKTPPAITPQIKSTQKQTQKVESQTKVSPTVTSAPSVLNDTIMPESFVSMQDEDDDNYYEPVYADDSYDDDFEEEAPSMDEIALAIKEEVNALFKTICFDIQEIEVRAYDATTLLIEFKGEDAALLIGKEGYRYKALSYMLFNWINTKYQVGLRLEIAEFLKNQEEAVSRYLENVKEIVTKDGRAQTKILDGVLVQIALKELREIYPDKYVAIRSTKDGLKYIIINDYHTN
jgi:spoIIIJ-associated protein